MSEVRCPARYDDALGMWVIAEPDEVRQVLLDPATFRPGNAVVAHTALSVKALRVLSSAGVVVTDPAAGVEDVLRESSSVPTWRRITAGPVTVGSVELPGDAPVLLGLIGHGGPADLAFGLGIHRCLGAGLARLESRVALECAARLLAGVRAVEQRPPMVDLLSFRAPARLLVHRVPADGLQPR